MAALLLIGCDSGAQPVKTVPTTDAGVDSGDDSTMLSIWYYLQQYN